MIDKLPKVIFVRDVADAVGWTVQRTRRALKSAEALKKRGRKFVTTKKDLIRVFPELYDAYADWLEQNGGED